MKYIYHINYAYRTNWNMDSLASLIQELRSKFISALLLINDK